jgi:hypothetical protein
MNQVDCWQLREATLSNLLVCGDFVRFLITEIELVSKGTKEKNHTRP